MPTRLLFYSLSLILILSPVAFSQEQPSCVKREGDLPLILIASHGGWDQPQAHRRTDKNLGTYADAGDFLTQELTLRLAYTLWKKSGRRPSLLIMPYQRAWLDTNRPELMGSDDHTTQAIHRRYYQALEELIEYHHQRGEKPLILDIHGQGTLKLPHLSPSTQLGQTLNHQKGYQDLARYNRWLTYLKERGWVSIESHLKEGPWLGGHLVRQHQPLTDDRIRASIQLEHSKKVRFTTLQQPYLDDLCDSLELWGIFERS